METSDQNDELFELLATDFQLPEATRNDLIQQPDFMNILRVQLARIVKELMVNDNRKLFHSLYRFDISEKHIQEALALGCTDEISTEIAGLIIKRQKQHEKTVMRVLAPHAVRLSGEESK